MTLLIRVYGIVQGVGFRPAVSRHAKSNNIYGSVCNKGPYVEIKAVGSKENLHNFLKDIKEKSPERSSILKIDVCETHENKKFDAFTIIESEKTKGDIFISPDIAICNKCKEELFDKNNRRYLHPFINCTCCGPRLTILEAVPYDRERTSMNAFHMCRKCKKEYTSLDNRRYDAQPVCCNACGPQVYLLGREERNKEAITYTRKVISEGGIAAVKGIGGFHLCCSAENEKAVSRLRKLKNRPVKPFAVMMKNLHVVKNMCEITKAQEEVLDGHQKPIILLKKKEQNNLCASVAPYNPNVGVMLPYAPIQLLLFDYDDKIAMPQSLVMTSGNISGAPICISDEEALNELGKMCDVILSNNRKIRIRSDDSVMNFFEGKPYMIRRSRGYAPLPFMISNEFKGQVVAVGGELKNSFCVAKNNMFYMSPYVGDMADIRTAKALNKSIRHMENLLEAEPQTAACDMHPKYNTCEAAENLKLPVVKVQHHFAHIVSCMAENNYSKPVIGVALDGTGYGTDQTIWGGEIMKASYDGFQRIGSIKSFIQAGGDSSSKEGWRIAVSMIHSLYSNNDEALKIIQNLKLCDEQNAKTQFMMADKKINSIISTSCGRLFDAASAVLGICRQSTFEGESSMALQFAAEEYEKYNSSCNIEDDSFEYVSCENNMFVMNTHLLIKKLVEERLKYVSKKDCKNQKRKLSYYFHVMLCEMIAEACRKACEKENIKTVALSGGVFQNLLLLKLCKNKLESLNINVLIHSMVPANDGGIALGQAVAAMAQLNR